MTKFLLFFTLFITSSCSIQLTKKKTMEKFNLTEFKNKSINSDSGHFFKTTKNDTVVEMRETKDAFTKDTYKINSPFKNTKVFYKDNLNLKAEWNRFYMVSVGILKKYDKNGTLIEEKDLDVVEKRNFSIYQLIKKMNEDFNIDLTDMEKIGVSTSYIPEYGYCYIINVLNYKAPGLHRQIMIDVNRGEIQSDEIVSFKK